MTKLYAELTDFLPNAIKVLLAVSIMVISMMSFIASINKAAAASPRPQVTVTDDVIRVGDVFEGVQYNADFVLAPAPLPGKELIWDSRTLLRVATAFDLPWRPSSVTDRVSIRRMANMISTAMLKSEIKHALAEKGVTGEFEVDFANGTVSQIILPHDVDPYVNVTDFSFNPTRKTFTATIETPSANDGQSVKTQIVGQAHPLVNIPVLKSTARRGETISRNDITTLAVRQDDITSDFVVSVDELVGMTPARIVRGGMPVDRGDLNKPLLVNRGEMVTMRLNNGPIKVTATARAMERGTKGDIIKLMNVSSKRTVEAQITGLREAVVLTN